MRGALEDGGGANVMGGGRAARDGELPGGKAEGWGACFGGWPTGWRREPWRWVVSCGASKKIATRSEMSSRPSQPGNSARSSELVTVMRREASSAECCDQPSGAECVSGTCAERWARGVGRAGLGARRRGRGGGRGACTPRV